jgi:hypothetical protein
MVFKKLPKPESRKMRGVINRDELFNKKITF